MAGVESPVQDLACFCPGTVACVQCRREKVVLVPNGSWQKIRQSTVFIHRVFGGYYIGVFSSRRMAGILVQTPSLCRTRLWPISASLPLTVSSMPAY